MACAGVVGLVLVVAAFGKGPPPCKGKAVCPPPVTVTVSDTTTVSVSGGRPAPSGPAPELADVSIASFPSASSVFADGNLTFTTTVANAGPSTATGISVSVEPGGSRLLASASGNVGTLAPGATATITLTLAPTVASGAMTATFRVSSNEPDPQPTNNVAMVTTPVLAGHAGPPVLQGTGGAFAPPLFARRSGAAWVVLTRVHVDEASTILVRVVDGAGREQTMLPGTLVDYLPAGRPHTRIPHVVGGAGWVPLQVRVAGAAGRSYAVVVGATGPDGSAATTSIGFRIPPGS